MSFEFSEEDEANLSLFEATGLQPRPEAASSR